MAVDPGFGIYIHWPFCQAKCPYCDFNSHVSQRVDHAVWRQAFVADIARQAERCDRAPVTSVFFGGGTPSLMEPATVAACLDEIARVFEVAAGCEVTLEANPTSSDVARFSGFRAAGVNRLSLGVQALNDADLKRLGRLHSADEAITAFESGRSVFDRVSFDLIYARQDQTAADWRSELDRALDLALDHLSLYQLTIEPGTRFGALHARGALRGLPAPDLSADLYEVTLDACAKAGFSFYEVSNAARPGAECQHNLTYWRYGPYLGIGPGAHGRRVTDGAVYATEHTRGPDDWLNAALRGNGAETESPVTPQDQAQEYALMGLRLSEGISVGRLRAIGGDIDEDETVALVKDGLLTFDGDRLATTAAGRLVLNAILPRVLA